MHRCPLCLSSPPSSMHLRLQLSGEVLGGGLRHIVGLPIVVARAGLAVHGSEYARCPVVVCEDGVR